MYIRKFSFLLAVIGLLLGFHFLSPKAEAVACSVFFQDVGVYDQDYDYITPLGQSGVISGYSCVPGGATRQCVPPQNLTYYEPDTTINRGQAAKIVSNAAGFTDSIPAGRQTFEDVPPASTFYTYIERLVSRGIISGYSCSASGGYPGPCVAPNNRPYFLPTNLLNRQEASKFVSNAAGFIDPIDSTDQSFADVTSSNNIFHTFIERLQIHHAADATDCDPNGGPPGACDFYHRSYFVPLGNVSRGSFARMVAQAFDTVCDHPNCNQVFEDVGPDNPFFNYINPLGVSNIVAGYTCGVDPAGGCEPPNNRTYFLPSSYTSRAQVAKLVVNAAHKTSTLPTDPTFSDVPMAHPFWPYVETAFANGIITGYSDGTFRPDNLVTRGQMAKFVSNAAGFTDAISSTTQSFADVTNADPFWLYIERLKVHGKISGYRCSHSGAFPGPCDATSRPYYVSNAYLTRAQMAKIVALAFNITGCIVPGNTPPPVLSCQNNGNYNVTIKWTPPPATDTTYLQIWDTPNHDFVLNGRKFTGWYSGSSFTINGVPDNTTLRVNARYRDSYPNTYKESAFVTYTTNSTNCPAPTPGPTLLPGTTLTPTNTPTPTPTNTPTPTPVPWIQVNSTSFQTTEFFTDAIPQVPIDYDTNGSGAPYFINNVTSPQRDAGVFTGLGANLGSPFAVNDLADVSKKRLKILSYYWGGLDINEFILYVKSKRQYVNATSIDTIQQGKVNLLNGVNITINNTTDENKIISTGQPTVIIINGGNLTINVPTFNAAKVPIAFVVATAPGLSPNGTTYFSTANTAANGIFISETVDTQTTTNAGLRIEGNLITNSLNNNRKWTDNRKPSLYIYSNVGMYLGLMNLFSNTVYEWKQLN
jgi:hypothetical protein